MSESSLSSSSLPFRLGTFNIGLGLQRKLPSLLIRFSSYTLDIIALQEIGDPALLNTRLSQYHFIYSPGISHHEGGVGLLISLKLVPFIRSYHRSNSGRLIGVVLELAKGQRTLIISAYMPSGLDHCSNTSDKHKQAHELYSELLRWTVGMHAIIVMGDLNQTLTRYDRQPQPVAIATASSALPIRSPISSLILDGFIDVYRHIYSSPELNPGFTHMINGMRPSQSRIDYIWYKGCGIDGILNVHIDTRLHMHSHHHLLWMEIKLNHTTSTIPITPLLTLRLPNLRLASDQQKDKLMNKIESKLNEHQCDLIAASSSSESAALTFFANCLTNIVHDSALISLPITGDKPYTSKCLLQLQRQRHDIISLLHITMKLLDSKMRPISDSITLTSSSQWTKKYQRCVEQYNIQWSNDIWCASDIVPWINETKQLLRDTRTSIRYEQHRMVRATRSNTKHDNRTSAAYVHRMLKSDAVPSQILSVVDSNGELTRSSDELANVMANHFSEVFTLPPLLCDDELPLPIPEMLLDKPTINHEWYNTLMQDVTSDELLSTLIDTPLVTAPGEDGVSTGLWKLVLHRSQTLRNHVIALFNNCIHTRSFPTSWKSSIIVPLVKDAQKERTMGNIRPISLQSCLGKLLNKVLAHRLGSIFASHPILNTAQRGFINGGTITKCIDELLDAWEWSRKGKCELYTLFYDIKQAYDSVQVDVLHRAMKRLRLPQSFIDLVVDSLSGLTSCVRTAYGHSNSFNVDRSLRQGDPLAPLLFVILMDALHDGLDCNPFDGLQHGLRMRLYDAFEVYLPSLGFADDTNALTNTLEDMRIQNDWVHYFMCFNQLRLNHSKCELVGRDADGQPVSDISLAMDSITIEGHALYPTSHDQPIRYLGVHIRFDGSWKTQQNKSLATIAMFTRIVNKFRVPLSQTVYMFNVFLMPMLELALHYVHGRGTNKWIQHCDRMIIGCIKHAVTSPINLSHRAVATSLQLLLPSWLEVAIKVSELFLRLNSKDERWGHMGRLQARNCIAAVTDSSSPVLHEASESRVSRASGLAVRELGWSLHFTDYNRRNKHLFDIQSLSIEQPSLDHCSHTTSILLRSGEHVRMAQDLWIGWGTSANHSTVHAYTDGSFDSKSLPQPTSAWAVTIADEWMHSNFHSIPTDEQLLQPYHVGGAIAFAASIINTRGIYPAELQAIARTLAMFPNTFTLHLHSDSKSSMQAIHTFEKECNERRRMRMSSRTLLQLISHLLQRRRESGGSVQWHHVKAHSDCNDIDSVGNRISDYHANRLRIRPHIPQPIHLKELPLRLCETHLTIIDECGSGLQIIDDIRQTAMKQLKHSAMIYWQSLSAKDNRGYIANPATVELGCVALQHGSLEQQHSFIHIATNSIHFHWSGPEDAQLLHSVCCGCGNILTLPHLASCADVVALNYRIQLHRKVVSSLRGVAAVVPWLHHHQHLPLSTLLLSLFPTTISPVVSADDHHRYFTRIMCGAYSHSQCRAAAKLIGCIKENDIEMITHALHYTLRLQCIDQIEQLYGGLKLPRVA